VYDPKFNRSKKTGDVGELKVLALIRQKYSLAYRIDGKVGGYDIVIPEVEKFVEVKYDVDSIITGNYFIEVEIDDELSGLSITTADYWAITNASDTVYIQPDRIWECISDHKIKLKPFKNAGVEDKKRAYLVPIDKLKPYAEGIQT
jgi:hypothetical protein